MTELMEGYQLIFFCLRANLTIYTNILFIRTLKLKKAFQFTNFIFFFEASKQFSRILNSVM